MRRHPDQLSLNFDDLRTAVILPAYMRSLDEEERSAVATFLEGWSKPVDGADAVHRFMRFMAAGAQPGSLTVRAAGCTATVRWTHTRFGYSTGFQFALRKYRSQSGGYLLPNCDNDGHYYLRGWLSARTTCARELFKALSAVDERVAEAVDRELQWPHIFRRVEPLDECHRMRLPAVGPSAVPFGGTDEDLLTYERAVRLLDVDYGRDAA